MSLIYGAIGYGKLIENGDAELLREELVNYPSDEFDAFQDDYCTVGLFSIRLRKEPFPQDRIVQNKNVIVIADARLDYRDELIEKINIEGIGINTTSDPILILKAYEKWGKKCIDHLEGDFVFLVYHKQTKDVWGARDPVGFRPLFFVQMKDQLLFSTSLKGLLSISTVSIVPNEDFWLQRFLSLDCPPSASPHKGIHQIPIGHEISFGNLDFNIKRFFFWKRNVKIVKGKNYELELKDILEKAVKTRLYKDYEVGAELSGGLDSSAVVAIASLQISEHDKRQKIWTVSSVANEQQNHPRDERPWIQSFVPHFKNVESTLFSLNEYPIMPLKHSKLFAFMRFRRYSSFPMERKFFRHFEQHNCKTILTGWRGDHYISRHSNYSLNELMLQGNLKYFLKNLRKSSSSRGISSFDLIKRLLMKNMCKNKSESVVKELLNKDWLVINGTKLDKNLATETIWEKKDMEWDFNQLLPQNGKELNFYMEDTTYLNNRTSYSLHPLSDHRVISYAINLPAEEFEKGGMNRSLFRRALKGIVPDKIRFRVNKGLFNFQDEKQIKTVLRALLDNHSELLRSSSISYMFDIEKVLDIIENYLETDKNKINAKEGLSLNILGYLLYFNRINYKS